MTDKITNKITKIVLTGGPCAGKTTAMARIIEHFSGLGFQVFAIPEVPTMFSSAGINYLTQNKALFFEAEKSTLNIQLALEDHFAKMASQCSKPVLIVCDRGTMDISAYVSPELWEALTEEMGTNTVKLRDARYEAILHMVTAAAGAEQFYTNENNKFRSEDVELARELDRKVLSAWTGHPHLRVIGNQTDFDDKLRQVLNEISTVLGVPCPIEQERKYIVKVTGEIPDYTESEITQTYLLSEPGTEMRVRKRGWQGSYVYFQTIKKTVSSNKQIETERRITAQQYVDLRQIADPNRNPISKMRKCFVWKNRYFELDTYIEPKLGMQILELEGIKEGDEVEMPPFIKIVEDITGNEKYYNYQLSLR